jgi:Uma2 family endonuclease
VGTKTLLTVEQFEQLPEEEAIRCELDQGELIGVSAPSYEHNRIRDGIVTALNNFLVEHAVGEAVAEQEFRITEDTVRRPDIGFLRREVAARIDKAKSILHVVPDLVVEIVSPSDTAEQLMRKVDQYLAHGIRAVWVVYPAERKVHAYGPNDEVRVFGEGKNLEAPTLIPGFSLPVSRIFE